ncbi:MAG: 7-carboxy-7-deazaguanine synthase [Ferrovum sp.]|jgi:7-carboxy-7-deazaguanine synthase (Cx14CxxC type)|nr:7-carboxy-7-deazaguanine synthase [Ferrovum sp.]NDU89305.1 7-carboxy-7-deazaguanine synthase [Ferrovum sp.]
MTYSVKEIFLTLQGEGCHTGRVAVFCRFAGCNLWSGRTEDRAQARCRFCDTDFLGTEGVGGGKFDSAHTLASAIECCWEDTVAVEDRMRRWVVLTGGEPLLQVDEGLIGALHERGFGVAVETNGTVLPPPGIDWICVSPKGMEPLQVCTGDELKLVYPQSDCPPERFVALNFRHFLLQPLDEGGDRRHEQAALSYCRSHPRWQLSLQTHKWLGIP